ncbi:hypothetical protein LX15_004427 [Streptoalloteichus tenebrarius]|uniref:Uncharacterized protein n=1 Tax=Streptoalloteichus tenebrarius (strain ATCC 17920 / DSM 40477 / JCM 4838 / CBS 697.72 / NBRC 16177 / NCIMB 11028 / NRRL B-12390 / A12253. 1 / ISP 5477) TaxID=1933 RepID=A0ABT1HYV4_STRSD|nr:class I SAM-dependent methyltransferase [Streptoalloteichus tenebrarius]MCP2260707.1 hypothetical protein [Streptoalloteichus tenebrarius]BFF03760.1 class I SAM-dependent methyltransferase [Streptoalloteichus tenebrarius]
MPTNGDPQLVELLLRTADGRDEEILQLANRTTFRPVLEVLFAEVMLDLLPEGDRRALVIHLDVDAGSYAHGYRVRVDGDDVSVEALPFSTGDRPAPAADVDVHLVTTLIEFVGLYRAVFGAEAARDGHRTVGDLFAAGSRVADLDWRELFARRADERADLTRLAVRLNVDKWGTSWYTPHYHRFFQTLRERPVKILEIGIGGYADPNAGGASLQMWKRYFPRGLVYGLDIADKSGIDTRRVRTFRGDQGDPEFLRRVIREIGPVDVVVDDGSHFCHHQIISFQTLFPHVAAGGFYAIEDLLTSYWPGFGGSSTEPDNPRGTVGYLKSLVHGLNHEEFLLDDYEPSYTDLNIVGIYFAHNVAIVEKGRNQEGSPGYLVPDEIKRAGLEDVPFEEWGPGFGKVRDENEATDATDATGPAGTAGV